ncbi:ABC transporter substrate-binding protein [Pseudorhodoferax sp. Leaf274]|uniref:ABC transporter substrate-binding protein n=1 Tax=Pseudorhodoferax sp. Leaf274 TaxID=1736318 RepID=UPI000702F79D|nr:ABC transporter substrate-binding protein [Pseudorhodoferax sp. Leaf274]KQP43535.1 ABC transporter substrate-binding protein [Pseudorhodoferax sp. Leaf274]
MLNRRTVLTTSAAGALTAALPALAQNRKDAMVLGMTLEPTGLDPTVSAAASIAEVTLYSIYETLTKIQPDGRVVPLLAESWDVSPDLKTYTFRLRRDVKFHNGEPFNAQTVKFAYERAGGEKSTNKDKRTFANLSVQAVDDYTVVLLNKEIDPDLPFALGQATAVIVEPKSVDTNAAKPVGTGPYQLESYNKGSALWLRKWPAYRNPAAAKLSRIGFRFISDPAAQAASLLAGDVDAFPRIATRVVAQFKNNPQFQTILAGSRAKTILAFNHRRGPLKDVRVRRAILAAIDRQAVIEGAADGFGTPIGSHYVPGAPGYVDTTGINPFDLDKAKKLMAESGIKTPLELTMTLPPPPYARQGGEVITAQLAKIGISVKTQNVEWAQWLSGTYGGGFNFDLSIVSHVEPFDLNNYAKPDYYWGYDSKEFRAVYDKLMATGNLAERNKLLGEAQRLLATDAANGFLYQPQFPTIAKKNVKGLWASLPIFANDLGALSWG